MKFELNINMDNAAFRDDPEKELESRLNRIALAVGNGSQNGKIIDSYGYHVGSWAIKN